MAVTTNYKMNRFKLQQIYNQKVELNVFSTHFLGVTLDIYLSSPNMNKLCLLPAIIKQLKVNIRNIRTKSKYVLDIVLVSLLSTLNIFHTFSYGFYCRLWTDKC